MFFHRKQVLTALLLLLAAVPLGAQSWAGKGRLQGTITNQQGKPVQGAKITLRKGKPPVDPKADGPAPILTNDRGKWSILGLTEGDWAMLIEKDGYNSSEGQVKVDEFHAAQPVNITLNPVSKEAQQQAAASAAGKEGMAAIDRGNELLQAGKTAEARAEYEKAIAKLDPANRPALLRGVASTYLHEKQADKAIETLKQALAIAPDDPESLKLIVNVLMASGREQEAQPYLAKLPQGQQNVDPDILLNSGIKHFNEGKLQDALAQFSRVIEGNPQLADAYYYRGLTYLGMNKKTEAKADFKKLLEIDPNHKYAADAKEFLKSL
jgi:tetratricopeptide (TPR) repeat protein